MRFSAHHLAALERQKQQAGFADAAQSRQAAHETCGLGIFLRLGLVLFVAYGIALLVMWLGQ